jgi:hypothetical protein
VSNISGKRKKVVIAILAAVGGIGFVNATPESSIELAKQAFMTAANVAMFAVIWDIYFGEDLAQKDLKSLLIDLGIITLVSAGTAFVIAKAIAVLLKDIEQGLGLFGWGIAGIVAGVVTGLLGLAWACYCDDLYRNLK